MDQRTESAGYALWLMPAGQTYRDLARMILALSRRHSTPRFEPHVTLLSGIALRESGAISRTAVLAGRLAPLEIRAEAVDFTEDYFRCLFFRVVPTNAVSKARASACKVFGPRDPQPYSPHMSLLYGNLPLEVKKRMASRPSASWSFQASRIHLYRVEGPVEAWRRVGSFSLR
jgi:2'-5' RNA ligase